MHRMPIVEDACSVSFVIVWKCCTTWSSELLPRTVFLLVMAKLRCMRLVTHARSGLLPCACKGVSTETLTPTHPTDGRDRPAHLLIALIYCTTPAWINSKRGGTPLDSRLRIRSLEHVNKAAKGESPFSSRLGLMSHDSCAPPRTARRDGHHGDKCLRRIIRQKPRRVPCQDES